MIEAFLIGLALIWSLIALGCVVLLIQDWKAPDYAPDDWGPKLNVSRPRYSTDNGRTWHYGPRLDPETLSLIEKNGGWSSKDEP